MARATSAAATPKTGGLGSFSATAAQEPTLRAGETVFYWSKEFTCGDLRGRCFRRIVAIRVPRTGIWPSPDGVPIEGRSKENATSATAAVRIEIFFERGLSIDTDRGVQRHRDINGKLLYKEHMLPLEKYQFIPSLAPAIRQG